VQPSRRTTADAHGTDALVKPTARTCMDVYGRRANDFAKRGPPAPAVCRRTLPQTARPARHAVETRVHRRGFQTSWGSAPDPGASLRRGGGTAADRRSSPSVGHPEGYPGTPRPRNGRTAPSVVGSVGGRCPAGGTRDRASLPDRRRGSTQPGSVAAGHSQQTGRRPYTETARPAGVPGRVPEPVDIGRTRTDIGDGEPGHADAADIQGR
jgi:hypothetical protein